MTSNQYNTTNSTRISSSSLIVLMQTLLRSSDRDMQAIGQEIQDITYTISTYQAHWIQDSLHMLWTREYNGQSTYHQHECNLKVLSIIEGVELH